MLEAPEGRATFAGGERGGTGRRRLPTRAPLSRGSKRGDAGLCCAGSAAAAPLRCAARWCRDPAGPALHAPLEVDCITVVL